MNRSIAKRAWRAYRDKRATAGLSMGGFSGIGGMLEDRRTRPGQITNGRPGAEISKILRRGYS